MVGLFAILQMTDTSDMDRAIRKVYRVYPYGIEQSRLWQPLPSFRSGCTGKHLGLMTALRR